MKKRITVIFSSPRKNGNSDKLAKAFILGAKQGGNYINEVIIRNSKIRGCIGCEYCYEHQGECVQKDDMQKVYSTLEKTDLIVFATPIYYQSFPSQLKALIDRLYVTENRNFPISGSVLLATYATPKKGMDKLTIDYYKSLADYHNWEDKGIFTVSGLDEKDDIIGNNILERVKEFGMTI
ncbi:flavodoxin family protein [Thomasclavelia cocleata]|uniref:flavodoxin family protein n=1 Tax=Thomasclavelia cocleata TaxID=69824 RepID=UPI00272A9A84|nr:flavodoxin family protein [Thomasclavelia cocleata]